MNTLQTLAVFLWLAILPTSCSQGSAECGHDDQCGWNSVCEGGGCRCIPGHAWSRNQRDCVDVRCHDSRCLDCIAPDKCRRCVDFIEQSTGQCLDNCHGSYMLVIEGVRVGKVCPVRAHNSMMRVYVAIMIGVGAGVVMTAVTALCFYWHTRESKSKKHKKRRPPTLHEIETVQVTQNPNHATKASDTNQRGLGPGIKTDNVYTANGHLPNGTPAMTSSPTNPPMNGSAGGVKRPTVAPPPPDLNTYRHLVSDLRVYVDTFLAMLREVKVRNKALDKGDNRTYVYKNVIHQLCRVLTILNTADPAGDVPPDGVLLLRWAHTILHKYLAIKDPEYWEPGSPVGTMTSTFKPDHRIIPNGKAQGTRTANNTFTYERYDLDELDLDEADLRQLPDYKELSIHLENDFTEPIEV